MILQILAAFFGTIGFSLIFNVPRKELVFCGIAGASGWFFYQVVSTYSSNIVTATFVATIVITAMSRIFAFNRKMPLTVFLIPGIIPLVPGAGIYYTMYDVIVSQSSDKGIETLKIAGVIAIGIILILALPKQLFNRNIFKLKEIEK